MFQIRTSPPQSSFSRSRSERAKSPLTDLVFFRLAHPAEARVFFFFFFFFLRNQIKKNQFRAL